MIIFYVINSLFKYWFRLECCCFKDIVHTKGINFPDKGCDGLYIHGNGGDTLKIISFDIINSLLKFWSRLEFCRFKAVVDTNLIKMIIKGYSNFSNKDFYGRLADISLITSISSERRVIFELRVTALSSIYFNFRCCCSTKYINSYSGC